MQDGGIERSRARFSDHFVTIFVFRTFPGSARAEFVKTARCHMVFLMDFLLIFKCIGGHLKVNFSILNSQMFDFSKSVRNRP